MNEIKRLIQALKDQYLFAKPLKPEDAQKICALLERFLPKEQQ